jgi:hypothetical protein
MALRATLLVVLATFLFSEDVRSENSPKLPGSTVKTEEVALKCDAVFVGQITDIGHWGPPTSPDLISLQGVKIKILQVLRGSVDSEISVEIFWFDTNSEESPKAQSTYIFFLNKTHVENTIQNIVPKLLPATEDNIAMVKKLISN